MRVYDYAKEDTSPGFANLKGAAALIPAPSDTRNLDMRAIICGPRGTGKTYFASLLLAGTDGCTLLLDDYKGAGKLAEALGHATSWIVIIEHPSALTAEERGFADIVFEPLGGGRYQFGARLRPRRGG